MKRRDFLKGLAVVGATISPVGKVVELKELKCSNCSAPLVITGEYTCECEYCGAKYAVMNLDEVVGFEEEVEFNKCNCECHDSYFAAMACNMCDCWQKWDHKGYVRYSYDGPKWVDAE